MLLTLVPRSWHFIDGLSTEEELLSPIECSHSFFLMINIHEMKFGPGQVICEIIEVTMSYWSEFSLFRRLLVWFCMLFGHFLTSVT